MVFARDHHYSIRDFCDLESWFDAVIKRHREYEKSTTDEENKLILHLRYENRAPKITDVLLIKENQLSKKNM